MPLQYEGVIYLNKEDNEMFNCIASYNTSKTQLHKRCVCCSVLRAAGGEVVTRLAEVESGVRGAGAGTHWHWNTGTCCWVHRSASKSCIQRFVITEKAPTRAFSWLKAATTAFSFKTLLRHYAKQTLTPRSLNVKLGPRPGEGPSRGLLRDYKPSDATF